MISENLIQLGSRAGDALRDEHSQMRRLFARCLTRAEVEAEFERVVRQTEKYFDDPEAGDWLG